MRSLLPLVLCLVLVIALSACRRGGEEAPEEVAPAPGLVVPDTTIVREVNTRIDVDPRLDDPEIQLEAHSIGGEVTLVGQVPTRRELDIAREIAASTPGVRQVWLDSVRVLADEPRERTQAPDQAVRT